jgi:guanylate kinase
MDEQLLDLLNSYKVPSSASELLEKTKIVFLVGVSGAGKDTILKELLKTGRYKLIVSHTTRPPRENYGVLEQNGKEYHFIKAEQALQMLLERKFIEAKLYSGNLYGTSVEEVSRAYSEGKTAISDIEVQGVAEYMKASSNVTPIFILPPDFETWQKRIKYRYKDEEPDQADLQKRMATAKQELEEALSKDYFEFVINNDLDRAVAAVDEIAQGSLSANKNNQARQLAQKLLSRL